ncbi:HTH domain-containing protein [Teratosphaeria destructans]|uniref:HTH domain-containing protein n=1 Tax=Teratosphaeria destructans TaxID=418781 RepID=A0A9W7SI69_9PEZI|nr:HTH domain-containing protein [Teratosphaeria destructans]
MEDIAMPDEPGIQSNEPTEQTPVASEAAIDDTETLTIYAAASSKRRNSGCGNVYVRDGRYVGKAWSLGGLSRRQAAMQAVLKAYHLATRGSVLGIAKKLVIVTKCNEAKALEEARQGKEPHMANSIQVKDCLAMEQQFHDAGLPVEVKGVEISNEQPGLQMALALSRHGFEMAMSGAKEDEEYDAADIIDPTQAAVKPPGDRRLQKREKRAKAMAFKQIDRDYNKQRREKHLARVQKKVQKRRENGTLQIRRSTRLQKQALQNDLQSAMQDDIQNAMQDDIQNAMQDDIQNAMQDDIQNAMQNAFGRLALRN